MNKYECFLPRNTKKDTEIFLIWGNTNNRKNTQMIQSRTSLEVRGSATGKILEIFKHYTIINGTK